jgi:hypothetical protein
MTKFLTNLLALLFISIHFSIALADGASVLKTVKPSMVSISVKLAGDGGQTGSGVIVSPNEILTNCHVVENSESVQVTFSDGGTIPATLIGRVSTLDLCLLSAVSNNRTPITISPISEIEVGQTVYAVGDPLALKTTISDGIISAFRQNDVGKLIQITTPISHGSSGGGLFDIKGRLLGITTFMLTEGQNLNFAIPAEYINSLGVNSIQAKASTPPPKKVQKITFKGIPFGISQKQFLAQMPNSQCIQEACLGYDFTYLGNEASSFVAMFKNNRLHFVNISFKKSNSNDLMDNLTKQLNSYFGQPTTNPSNIQTAVKITWKPNSDQDVELSKCVKSSSLCVAEVTIYDNTEAQMKTDF